MKTKKKDHKAVFFLPLDRQIQNIIVQKMLFNLAAILKPMFLNGEVPDMLYALGLLIPGPDHAYDVYRVLEGKVKQNAGIESIQHEMGKINLEHVDDAFCKELIDLIDRYFIKKTR